MLARCGDASEVLVGRLLPSWAAVTCHDNDPNDSNTADDASGDSQNGADDVTGYCSDTDSSGPENSEYDDDDDGGGDDGSIT